MISLISDLGLKNPLVGIVESKILHYFQQGPIVITHQVQPFNLTQGAFFWKCIGDKYPPNTFHVSLIDCSLNMPAAVLVAEVDNHYYIGIDNGLFPLSFSGKEVQYFTSKKIASNILEWVDIAIDSINVILNKGLNDWEFIPYHVKKIYDFPKVLIHENSLECHVIFIDNYGSIVTNLTKLEFELLRNNREYSIVYLRNDVITEISDNFIPSNSGGVVAFFNEFGYLQLSMRAKSNTASLLGMEMYQSESLINNYIRIDFK